MNFKDSFLKNNIIILMIKQKYKSMNFKNTFFREQYYNFDNKK